MSPQNRLRAGAAPAGMGEELQGTEANPQGSAAVAAAAPELCGEKAADCGDGGMTPQKGPGCSGAGPGVGSPFGSLGAEVPALLPCAGPSSPHRAEQGRPCMPVLVQIPGAGAAEPRGSRRWEIALVLHGQLQGGSGESPRVQLSLLTSLG